MSIWEMLAKEKMQWKSLGKVCEIKTGEIIGKREIKENKGIYPVINSGKEPLGFINKWNTENDPIGINSREALNYSVTIKDTKQLNVRFLYY